MQLEAQHKSKEIMTNKLDNYSQTFISQKNIIIQDIKKCFEEQKYAVQSYARDMDNAMTSKLRTLDIAYEDHVRNIERCVDDNL